MSAVDIARLERAAAERARTVGIPDNDEVRATRARVVERLRPVAAPAADDVDAVAEFVEGLREDMRAVADYFDAIGLTADAYEFRAWADAEVDSPYRFGDAVDVLHATAEVFRDC